MKFKEAPAVYKNDVKNYIDVNIRKALLHKFMYNLNGTEYRMQHFSEVMTYLELCTYNDLCTYFKYAEDIGWKHLAEIFDSAVERI